MAHGKAEELTGHRRYRSSGAFKYGKPPVLVLQVEVSYFLPPPPYDKHGGGWKCRWRDATTADVASGELCG